MNEFFRWLLSVGFIHTNGDIHWQNYGYWFPKPPEDLSGDATGWWIRVTPNRENQNEAFIDSSSKQGVESLAFTDNPEKAKRVVDEALARWMYEDDEAKGAFSGFFPKKDPRVGKTVYVHTWEPPFEGKVYSAVGDWLIVRRLDDGRLITMKTEDVRFVEKTENLDGYDDDRVSQSCDSGAHERCTGGEVCDCSCHRFKRVAVRCTCGKSYTQAKFKALPFVGATSKGSEFVESRLCPCGEPVVQ